MDNKVLFEISNNWWISFQVDNLLWIDINIPNAVLLTGLAYAGYKAYKYYRTRKAN
jgi:hypothetical protein